MQVVLNIKRFKVLDKRKLDWYLYLPTNNFYYIMLDYSKKSEFRIESK